MGEDDSSLNGVLEGVKYRDPLPFPSFESCFLILDTLYLEAAPWGLSWIFMSSFML